MVQSIVEIIDKVRKMIKEAQDMVQSTVEIIDKVRKRIKEAQDRQKSYADKRRRELQFEVEDKVFLKLSPAKGIVRFGKKGKLKPRFLGPFEILERIGEVAYRLALPPRLGGMHDVFHVSMLRKYVFDPSHVIHGEDVELNQDLTYTEVPVAILDRKIHKLRNKPLMLVKVQWSRHGSDEATWEIEDEIMKQYPNLPYKGM